MRQAASEHANALRIASLDGEIAEIVMRGWADLERLDPVERYRFDLSVYQWLSSAEQAFADYASGQFPEESLTVFKNNIPGVMRMQGGIDWWD